MITIPGIFGAPLWLGFTWRRLTKWAVIIQVTICIFIYALIPNLFQTLNWSKHNEAFLLQTRERTIEVVEGALSSDVEQGRAEFLGQKIEKERIVAPSGVFFERVARTDPEDPDSPKIGLGRFNAEIWVLSWLGIDFTRFSKAQLVATRFIFDALFPFFLLFLFSYLTRPVDAVHLDRFYAKLHTPVQPSAELEAKALEESYANPGKYTKRKLFPRSQWEIMKPGWNDIVGFGGSWLLVGVIIALLIIMVSIK
jgi:SSS family solute:Na+ symporter